MYKQTRFKFLSLGIKNLSCESEINLFIQNNKVNDIKQYIVSDTKNQQSLVFVIEYEEKAIDKNINDNPELFNFLKSWRLQYSKDKGIPPYLVCNNDVLATIAQNPPQSINDLAKIKGIGEAKIKIWGNEILLKIKEFCHSYE